MAESTEYKKIVRVRFLFKFKWNNLLISLVKNEDGTYDLPRVILHKGQSNSYYKNGYSHMTKEVDRDDFELWVIETKNIHQNKNHQWIDTLKMDDYNIPLKIKKDIYTIILDNYSMIQEELGKKLKIRHIYYEKFKALMYEKCKEEYIENIKWYLAGNKPIILDGVYIPMKEGLLRKELETLEHFKPTENKYTYGHVFKSPFLTEEEQDETSELTYSYWFNYEDFGGGTKSILPFLYRRFTNNGEK